MSNPQHAEAKGSSVTTRPHNINLSMITALHTKAFPGRPYSVGYSQTFSYFHLMTSFIAARKTIRRSLAPSHNTLPKGKEYTNWPAVPSLTAPSAIVLFPYRALKTMQMYSGAALYIMDPESIGGAVKRNSTINRSMRRGHGGRKTSTKTGMETGRLTDKKTG